MKFLGIEMPFEEFDRLMCEQSKGKELKVINGKVVAVEYQPTQQDIAENRVRELKQLLADTDYKAIKYAEGVISEAEYEPIKTQRQEWRDEINELESQIKGE